MIKTIRLAETDSTNRFLREYSGERGERVTIAVAEYQTAGRGQGTNSWESERGKNLTFSMLSFPTGLPANRQYTMLEAGALAIFDTLSETLIGETSEGALTIKWPNDIYWNDKKISGTLSECTIRGGNVDSCIIGSGININQTQFVSDAPNPVSLRQITGRETDREKLLQSIAERFVENLDDVDTGDYAVLHDRYMSLLYRRNGFYPYEDAGGRFEAEIADVLPSGHLLLRLRDGSSREYAFKEVGFLSD